MNDEIEEVLRARDTSYWLLEALHSALERDPVDALHDAQLLARLISIRTSQVLANQFQRERQKGALPPLVHQSNNTM